MITNRRTGLREHPLPASERKPVEVARLGLHAHNCSECGALCICYQRPCEFRGRASARVLCGNDRCLRKETP
jgi:hypothetical protein